METRSPEALHGDGDKLDRDEAARPSALADALRNAASEAQAALARPDPEKAVHDIRKAFKRLRALLRLVRGGRRSEEAKALRRELGEAARKLSGARDGTARTDALDDLVRKGGLDRKRADRLSRREIAASTEDEAALQALASHRTEIESLIMRCRSKAPDLADNLGRKALVRSLTDDYRRARRRLRLVDPTDDESLHDLRKSVIAQRYQMELATPGWPRMGKLWVDELQKLRDKLGKHHDLAVLTETRSNDEDGAFPDDDREYLLRSAGMRQDHLAGSSLRLGRRIFCEKPRAFARRIQRYFAHVA